MLMCQLSAYLYAEAAPVPSLLHIWRELTDRHVNWSQCCWCVNCQLDAPLDCSQLASYMKRAYRYTCQLVPMLVMCQLSAYLSAKDAPLDCSQLASYMKRVCMQKDMSTCPNAVVVSTVSIFVSMSQGFSRTIPWQTIVNHSMPYLTMANHNKSFHAIPDLTMSLEHPDAKPITHFEIPKLIIQNPKPLRECSFITSDRMGGRGG